MDIAVIGINHSLAPIEIREKASFSESKKIEATGKLADRDIEETVILSTCNRSEIYIASEEITEAAQKVKQFYGQYFHDEDIIPYVFVKEKEEAIGHLYEVCSGLQSIVIGEDQILGQVKDAIETAIELKGSSKILNKLFREAITVAKDIKTTTKVSDKPLSISYIGVKKLREVTQNFKDKTILLVGLGKMGQLALTHIQEEQVGKIFVCNRSIEKSRELAAGAENIEAVPYGELKKVMEMADILICSTASPHVIIKKEDLDSNRKKPLYILDLALPRDVEPQVADYEFVKLYNIDTLKEESEENEKIRLQLLEDSRYKIEQSMEAFNSWKNNMVVDPVIQSFHERCRYIKEDAMSYISRKTELSHKDKKIVDKMIESSMKRLLREAILKLKETKEEEKLREYVKVMTELFEF